MIALVPQEGIIIIAPAAHALTHQQTATAQTAGMTLLHGHVLALVLGKKARNTGIIPALLVHAHI